MASKGLEDIDTSLVLMNLIDTCPVKALPYLAEQFNILSGFKGWRFATTEQMQRDLLKRAIELNTHAGTPYAIKEVLKLIGVVGQIEIQERLVITYDGSWSFDGLVFYGNHVAYFRVIIDISNLGNIDIEDIRGVILEYKAVRNRLFDISYRIPAFVETLQSADDLVQEVNLKINDTLTSLDTLTIT
jgi:P2-related tail formation protein